MDLSIKIFFSRAGRYIIDLVLAGFGIVAVFGVFVSARHIKLNTIATIVVNYWLEYVFMLLIN